MGIEEDIQPVTYLKSHAAEVLAQINRTRRPMVITQNGKARAVLQDVESYEETRRTLGLMKLLAQGEQEIEQGKVVAQDDLFARIDKKFQEA